MLSECWLKASVLSGGCFHRAGHNMTGVTFHHPCCRLLTRSKSQNPTFTQGRRLQKGMDIRRQGSFRSLKSLPPIPVMIEKHFIYHAAPMETCK